MLAGIIFMVLFNCFPAEEHRQRNNRVKFVETVDGTVRGHLADDGNYMAFLGMPYADPPVGNNRFKSPLPVSAWDGVYDAVRTVKCPQDGEGEENCLVVNVFTPVQIGNILLPVLAYIHGGSFIKGHGPTRGMDYLIKQNIIVVTMNYRLGALGFLCIGIKDAPGNAGLKDQVAALKWVQSNIELFGGNPHEVTIYGTDAGAASAELLVLSDVTKGLFKQAIVESGSATSVWALDPTPIRTAKNMITILKSPQTSFMEIFVEYLKKMNINRLTKANYKYYKNLTDGTFGFVPCVEKQLRQTEPLITMSPLKMLENKKFHEIPMMFLYTTLEGLHFRSEDFYASDYKKRMEKDFVEFIPADLDLEYDDLNLKEMFKKSIAEKVRRFYFGNGKNIGVIDYLRYFGDYLVLHSLLNSVVKHVSGYQLVYLMEFAYKGGLGGHDSSLRSMDTAGHGDIVKYVILNTTHVDKDDSLTVRRMTTLIANFMKHGNPTPSITPLLPLLWPPVLPGHLSYVYYDKDFELGSRPYEERMSFWDRLYAKFRRPVSAVEPRNEDKIIA